MLQFLLPRLVEARMQRWGILPEYIARSPLQFSLSSFLVPLFLPLRIQFAVRHRFIEHGEAQNHIVEKDSDGYNDEDYPPNDVLV